MAKSTATPSAQNQASFAAICLQADFDPGNKDHVNSMDVICVGDKQPFTIYPSDEVVKAMDGWDSIVPWSKVAVEGVICGKARTSAKGFAMNTPNIRVTSVTLIQ